VEISWDTVQEGQPFATWHLQITEDGNRTYCEQIAETLPVYRYAAHPHWLLAIANRALTREYLMPAWIHVGSEIRMRSLVRVGDTLEISAVPLEKWERKGHEFIKLYLAYHRDDVLTTEVVHTAIFKVAT
jgi:acyl dehydratase